MHEPSVESPLHEGSAIRLRGLIKFAIWFVIAGAATHAIIWGVFVGFRGYEDSRERAITGVAGQYIPPPEPRLQPSVTHNSLPVQDLAAMREKERAEFVRRGWLDEKTQSIRIPEEVVAQVVQLSRSKAATRPATRPVQK